LVATSKLLGCTLLHSIREYAPLYPVVALPVGEFQLRREVVAMYRKDGYLSPAGRRCIEILKLVAKEITLENR